LGLTCCQCYYEAYTPRRGDTVKGHLGRGQGEAWVQEARWERLQSEEFGEPDSKKAQIQ
jgi:hypothetical protein